MRCRGSLWRPVREVWRNPLTRGTYQPYQQEQPRPRSGKEAYQELVSAFRKISGLAEELDSGRTQRMALQCLRSMQELARHGPSATCDDTRPRLGYSCSCRGSWRQGALRMVRRTYRIYLQHQGTLWCTSREMGHMAEVVAGSRDSPHTLHR